MSNKVYKAINKNGEVRSEHRIIVESILGRRLSFNEVVHHIDGNKNNNDPSNLTVVTRQEHAAIHKKDIDRSKPVIQMDSTGQFIKIWPSARAADKAIPTATYQNIYKCCRGLRKTAGGYMWKYAE